MAFASLGISYLLFCVSHWVFAMKYWSISLKLDLHYQCLSIKKYDDMLSRVNYSMILLNITIPIFLAIFEGLDKPG
jgi:hypothetical protein